MKKKQQKTQLILISIGLLLILLTYFYYPYMNKDKPSKDQSARDNLEKIPTDQFTTFESLKYEGIYDLNKTFTIKSEKAYILDEEPDIVYMTNMHVILYLENERIINIISDKGRYNKVTHDCFFEENVEATDAETKIFSQNLDMLSTKRFVKIYNNVKLNHPMGVLFSDKIDYDFETKYFKVSMFDDKAVKMKVIK